jgi:hypothetical protein
MTNSDMRILGKLVAAYDSTSVWMLSKEVMGRYLAPEMERPYMYHQIQNLNCFIRESNQRGK